MLMKDPSSIGIMYIRAPQKIEMIHMIFTKLNIHFINRLNEDPLPITSDEASSSRTLHYFFHSWINPFFMISKDTYNLFNTCKSIYILLLLYINLKPHLSILNNHDSKLWMDGVTIVQI